jgi:putative endonuclease
MKKRATGTKGEKLACEFLGRNGYDIVETNYRCPEGEIDIVARHRETLVFIEVRTKTSRQFGGERWRHNTARAIRTCRKPGASM